MTDLEAERLMAIVLQALERNRFGGEALTADRALRTAGRHDELQAMIAAQDAGNVDWMVEYYADGADEPSDCHPDVFPSARAANAAAVAFLVELPWARRWTLRVVARG